jgi:hypothetical protein
MKINENASLLNEVPIADYFTSLKMQKLHYDQYYGIHLTKNSRSTINKLYGKFPFIRNAITFRYFIGSIIKYLKYKNCVELLNGEHFQLPLPKQPIAYIGEKRVVLISGSEEIVLKLEKHIYISVECISYEIQVHTSIY